MPLILVVGESGRGKSRGVKNLDPDTTAIINVEGKTLPFKEAKNFKQIPYDVSNPKASLIDSIKTISDFPLDKVSVVVIDSLSKWSDDLYVYAKEAFRTSRNKYEIPEFHNQAIKELLDIAKASPQVVIMTGHPDMTQTSLGDTTLNMAVMGGKWKGKLEREATIVFYANVKKNDEGKTEWFFETQSNGVTTAKSPEGMFDSLEIPNDYAFVLDKVKKYYEAE